MRALWFSLPLLLSVFLLVQIYDRLPVPRGVAPTKTRDVFFIYTDASTLAAGRNPYQRIEGKGLEKNEKYTFYLPGFLWLAAGSIRYLGYTSYEEWMRGWIAVSFSIHLLIGLLLYVYAWNRWGALCGILAGSFWWFSRWPLALLRSGQIDNIAILFFVLALILVERRRLFSLCALGVSLSIKQMAAFTVPLFLIFPFLATEVTGRKRLLGEKEKRAQVSPRARVLLFFREVAALIAVPLLVSLPFLFWDVESFFQMLIFPLTREPSGPRSVEYFLGEVSLIGKIPFFLLIGCSYLYFIGERRFAEDFHFSGVLFVLLLFLGFNPVFFSRYFCWAIPVIPLAVFECIEQAKAARDRHQ
ncbi:hypothetical protein MRY87_06360 [bacterium]|nr:hypothetical protein [bacterium]